VTIAAEVRPGRWVDSARLMAASRTAEDQEGTDRASCFMATPANLQAARDLGLWHEAMSGAGADDLVLVAEGGDPQAGLEAAAAALDGGGGTDSAAAATQRAPRSLARVEGDLAVVSVPGEYAALEAHKALGGGMDVLLFSDGVALEDEVRLKRRAHALGRLVMGPGAGTAILDGVGLAFANVLTADGEGPGVGVVAAAGTGAQEVTVLLDRMGVRVTACYGTGGRDLKEEVGAVTALDAIARLSDDPDTAVILCVSKPPAPAVAQRVLDALAATEVPAAACFVGAPDLTGPDGVVVAATLEDAAVAAARQAGRADAEGAEVPDAPPVGGFVRGLFSGGTLCSEAAAILADALGDVVSNAPAGKARALDRGAELTGHACLDLGEEEFTRGRPHPMIDPEARVERLREEAGRPEVGVLLLDVVLGHGSHPDPAGELAPALRDAKEARPDLEVVAHVLGTEKDPQVASAQERTLTALGVRVCASNAAAARLAARLAAAR
jgi:FdrA protein